MENFCTLKAKIILMENCDTLFRRFSSTVFSLYRVNYEDITEILLQNIAKISDKTHKKFCSNIRSVGIDNWNIFPCFLSLINVFYLKQFV